MNLPVARIKWEGREASVLQLYVRPLMPCAGVDQEASSIDFDFVYQARPNMRYFPTTRCLSEIYSGGKRVFERIPMSTPNNVPLQTAPIFPVIPKHSDAMCIDISPTSPLPPPGRYTLSFLTASCTGCFLALMSDISHRKPLAAESSVAQPTTFSLSQLSMCLSGGRLLLECASTLPVSSAKLLVISTYPVSADCGVSLQPFSRRDWPSGGTVYWCNVVPPSCPILCREQHDREGRAHQAPSLSCWTNRSEFLSVA